MIEASLLGIFVAVVGFGCLFGKAVDEILLALKKIEEKL